MDRTTQVILEILAVIIVLSAASVIVGILYFRTKESTEKMNLASFSANITQTEDGEYFIMNYNGLPGDGGGEMVKKISGEDITVRIWKSGGTWEDYVLSGEIKPYELIKFAVPEDTIGYSVLYKGEKIKGLSYSEG